MPYGRANIQRLEPYAPGEQPVHPRLVKLNTNENPFPPSQAVLDAIRTIDPEALRRYPSPSADRFREVAARIHGVDPRQVIATNGGDELLRLALTAFCDVGEGVGGIGVEDPTYSLYHVLADTHDTPVHQVPLLADWSLPEDFAASCLDAGCRLALVVNPHAPSGRLAPVEQLADIASRLQGQAVLLVDEAYVDFARQDALGLLDPARGLDNVLILRSLSKGYSLAGLRFGYGVGSAGIVEALGKVRDSYNVDAIAQRAAEAALADRATARDGWRQVIAERERVTAALTGMSFTVPASETNFVLATEPDGASARSLFEGLKEQGVYVRYFSHPRLEDKLRITIGTTEQNDRLLGGLRQLLEGLGRLAPGLAFCLSLLLAQASGVASEGRPASDEAPAARAWMERLDADLAALAEAGPAIAAIATDAAQTLTAHRGNLHVRGGGLAYLLPGRPGSLAIVDMGTPKSGDVLLVSVGRSPVEFAGDDPVPPSAWGRRVQRELAAARRDRDRGAHVIAIASQVDLALLSELNDDDLSAAADAWLPAPPVWAGGRSAQAPTAPAADAALAWALVLEVYAACLTTHRAPAVLASPAESPGEALVRIPTRRWIERDASPIPADPSTLPDPGELTLQYVAGLRAALRDVATAEWPAIAATARSAAAALQRGGRVYWQPGSAYLGHTRQRLTPRVDRLLRTLDGDRPIRPEPGMAPQPTSPGVNDFVLAVGLAQPPGDAAWGDPDRLRQAGLGVTWVTAGFYRRGMTLPAGERFIDPRFSFGDTPVVLTGGDDRLGGARDVLIDAVVGAVLVETLDRLAASSFATARR